MRICIQCGKDFKEGTGITPYDEEHYCSQTCCDNYSLIMNNETSGEDDVVCPYCGHVHEDSAEFEDDDDDFECYDCGRVFSMQRDYVITYNTQPHIDELLKMKVEESEDE